MDTVETWTVETVERLAPASPPWVHGLLVSLAMENVVIRGRPAMALSFVSPEVIWQDGSDGKSVTLKSFALVEDADGYPAMAVDRSRPDALPDLRDRPFHRDLGSYAAGWCSGSSAWAMIITHHPHAKIHDLYNAKRIADRRIADLIAHLMDRSGFSEGFRRNLRLIATWTPAAIGVQHVFARGPNADYLRALASESAAAGELLCEHHALGPDIATGAMDDAARDIGSLTGLSKAHLSWLCSLGQSEDIRFQVVFIRKTLGGDAFINLLPSIPADWLPRNKEQVEAMLEACILLLRSGNLVPSGAKALSPCKGDWVGFMERCTRMHGEPISIIDHYSSPLKDPVSDFASKIVLPVDAHHRPGKAMGIRDGYVHREVAAKLLYRDKSLPACLEAARWWHDHLDAILSEIPSEPDLLVPWEPLFRPTDIMGLRLVALCTALDLREEGSRGRDGNGVPGLAHCVRTYQPRASAGLCHIVSVRRVSSDGGYVRLATAELRQSTDGTLSMIQVQGRGNGIVPPEALEAMQEFLSRNPKLPYGAPRETKGVELGYDDTRRACGYDWTDTKLIDRACEAYMPMLARHLRDDASCVRAEIVESIEAILNPWFPDTLREILKRGPSEGPG